MTLQDFNAKEGIEECKKVITATTDFAATMSKIDWSKVGKEMSDLDPDEKKELINMILQKIIGAVLNILSR